MKHQIGDTITQQTRGTEHRYTLARTFEAHHPPRPQWPRCWCGRGRSCQTCGSPFEATRSHAPQIPQPQLPTTRESQAPCRDIY